MKPKMMSRNTLEHLFDHILDGFKTSHEGILNLEQQHLVPEHEVHALLKKNSERLIARIKEFKLLNGLLSLTFVTLFTWLQVTGDDLELRRPTRTRVRRRNETEQTQ